MDTISFIHIVQNRWHFRTRDGLISNFFLKNINITSFHVKYTFPINKKKLNNNLNKLEYFIQGATPWAAFAQQRRKKLPAFYLSGSFRIYVSFIHTYGLFKYRGRAHKVRLCKSALNKPRLVTAELRLWNDMRLNLEMPLIWVSLLRGSLALLSYFHGIPPRPL